MLKISLCFLTPFFCSFMHWIYHTCCCQCLLSPRFSSRQLWMSHQVSVFWAASFFSTSQWLGTWRQKSRAHLAGTMVVLHPWILEGKRILIFSSVGIPGNILQVFPRRGTTENAHAGSSGWIEDAVLIGDILEKERKCAHLSTEKQQH